MRVSHKINGVNHLKAVVSEQAETSGYSLGGGSDSGSENSFSSDAALLRIPAMQ
jgi:hypothetical protein